MQFGLIEMWQAMGAVAKTVAFILIFLSVICIYLFIERQLTFARAKRKSKGVFFAASVVYHLHMA